MGRLNIPFVAINAVLRDRGLITGYGVYDSKRIYQRINKKFVSIGWRITGGARFNDSGSFDVVILDDDLLSWR